MKRRPERCFNFVLVQEILLSYKAVGINEQWSLSMELFDVRVKSPVERWDAEYTRNTGVKAPGRAELTEWAHNSSELHDLLSHLQIRNRHF